MLEEILEKIQQPKRQELIDVIEYGAYSERNREAVYNDHKKHYEILKVEAEPKIIGSVKSFAAYINEECKRRENETGSNATVKMSLQGGYFIPDEDFNEGLCNYKRIFSQQWLTLSGAINKTMSHKGFMLTLQKLKPSIDNFDAVFKKFSMIRLIGNSELTSNPIFVDGDSEQGYKCKYTLDAGGEGEETFPNKIALKMPFAKASDFEYELEIELLFVRDEDNEMQIEVYCTDYEVVEEQAIIDEAKFITDNTKELTDLLVLADF